ncbi:MAG: hypothetical protein K2L12_04425, partial [Clostridia bacterium]|nr:hypothetical protein [Clostridia bacterium]
MKKLKVLAIMLAMVLCFGVFAFVGCDNGDKPGPGPDNSGSSEVPVVDGKVTFYFTVADGSVDIPEYGAVYYAGGLTGWATADAPAFTKLEGKNVYYIQLEVDNTKDQWKEYAVVLGYNATSGLPADKQGVNWDLNTKSDECAAVAYPDNLKFEMADGAKTVNLGTHTFTNELPEPTRISTELRVTFDEALPAGYDVYFMGGFTNWDAANAKATPNADRTIYSLAVKDILCTNYEYKIVILATGEGVVTKDAEGNDLGVWDQYFADPTKVGENYTAGDKVMARVEVSNGGKNLTQQIIKRDNNSSVDLANTNSTAGSLKGIKLTDARPVKGDEIKDGDNVVGNVYTYIISFAVTKTLKVEFTAALPEGVIVFCPGSLIDWSGNGTKMTISSDRKSATLDAELLPGDYQFKLVFFVNEDAYDGNVWAGTEYNNNGGNWAVTVEGFEAGEAPLFEEAIVAPVSGPVEADLVLTVKFDADMTGKIVKIKGQMTGWEDKVMVMGEDKTTFTVTVSKEGLMSGEKEFLIGVGDADTTDFYADGHKIAGEGTYGGGNSKVTIP